MAAKKKLPGIDVAANCLQIIYRRSGTNSVHIVACVDDKAYECMDSLDRYFKSVEYDEGYVYENVKATPKHLERLQPSFTLGRTQWTGRVQFQDIDEEDKANAKKRAAALFLEWEKTDASLYSFI